MAGLRPTNGRLLEELDSGGPILELVGPASASISLPDGHRRLAVEPSGLETLEPNRFRLALDATGALTSLQTQDEQVRAFQHVAASLHGNGVFAVATEVPDVSRYPQGQRVRILTLAVDRVELELSHHQAAAQQVTGTRLVLERGRGGARMEPFRFRYVWPSELDLMAKLAGLQLRNRFADWDGSPFADTTCAHVSVYSAPRRRATKRRRSPQRSGTGD